MKTSHTEMGGFREILERKQAEMVPVLRPRDDISILKSADLVDRDSILFGDVNAAPLRVDDGSLGRLLYPERR